MCIDIELNSLRFIGSQLAAMPSLTSAFGVNAFTACRDQVVVLFVVVERYQTAEL
jgi:hypothetical protein